MTSNLESLNFWRIRVTFACACFRVNKDYIYFGGAGREGQYVLRGTVCAERDIACSGTVYVQRGTVCAERDSMCRGGQCVQRGTVCAERDIQRDSMCREGQYMQRGTVCAERDSMCRERQCVQRGAERCKLCMHGHGSEEEWGLMYAGEQRKNVIKLTLTSFSPPLFVTFTLVLSL